MLVDDVTIQVVGGHGGRGAVAFNTVKRNLGPTGSDGGRGGGVYLEGTSNLDALQQFRYKKELIAADGEQGKKQLRDGAAGADLIVNVPVGTVITNVDTGEVREITQIGARICVARGGRGGRGNYKFRSSTNTSPREYEEGKSGETYTLRLELKLIADVGLIGLPNAGKSTLLNELTGAQSKIGNYPFTTLEPNLGVYYELVIADIPGLIDGAAGGRGLGVKFLQHVERTRTLFHLISIESDDPIAAYRTVRTELSEYDSALAEKEEHVFLSKCDEAADGEVQEVLAKLHAAGISAQPLSIIDEAGKRQVIAALERVTREKTVPLSDSVGDSVDDRPIEQ